MNIKGAYPSELLNGNLLVGHSRTAFSNIPTLTPVNFDIKAVNKNQTTETYTATVASDCMSYTVAIPLDDSPKTYTIQANVSGDYGIFLTTETDEFTISIDDAVNQNLDLTLKAAQTTDTLGVLQLTVSIASDSGIKSGRLCYKEYS